MIAFLGAMDVEVDGIKEQLTDTTITKVGPYEYYLGSPHGGRRGKYRRHRYF